MIQENALLKNVMDRKEPFIISRMFHAPQQLLFTLFTDPAHMQKWFSPKGFTVITNDMDLRPGGVYHYGLKGPEEMEMWGKVTYREIQPPDRLVYINAFSDKDGGTARHPLADSWPLEMLTTITFAPQDDKTELTIEWMPIDPTEEENITFYSSFDGMRQGWTGSFDQLEQYLATIKIN